ncbi:MAG: hypothetical protein WD025_05895 [Bacteriovoracaceae bacterium]
MRLFISLLAIFLESQASVIVVYDSSQFNYGRLIQKRFAEKHHIPRKLAKVFPVKRCPEKREFSNRLVLCATNKELEVLNSSSSIIKSLTVFKGEAE